MVVVKLPLFCLNSNCCLSCTKYVVYVCIMCIVYSCFCVKSYTLHWVQHQCVIHGLQPQLSVGLVTIFLLHMCGINRNFSCFSLYVYKCAVFSVVHCISTSIILFFYSFHSIPSHLHNRRFMWQITFMFILYLTQNSHLILINCCSQLICLHALASSHSLSLSVWKISITKHWDKDSSSTYIQT